MSYSKSNAYNKHGGSSLGPQAMQKPSVSRYDPSKFRRTTPGAQPGSSGIKPTVSSNIKPAHKEVKLPPKPTLAYSKPLGNQASSISCYNCGNKGHYANTCPLPKRQSQGFAANVIDDNDKEPSTKEGQDETQEVEELPEEQEENQEDIDSQSQDENPEGAQYEPEDGPDRYIWTDEEDNIPQSYFA